MGENTADRDRSRRRIRYQSCGQDGTCSQYEVPFDRDKTLGWEGELNPRNWKLKMEGVGSRRCCREKMEGEKERDQSEK